MEDRIDKRVEELRTLPNESIAMRLKAFRKQYGYTQKELAQRAKVTRENILRWENVKVRISTAMLRILVAKGIL